MPQGVQAAGPAERAARVRAVHAQERVQHAGSVVRDAGTGRRRQQDATGRAPAAPPGIRERLALLAEAGYRHLGETRLELPVGERFAWIATADDGSSYAILAGVILVLLRRSLAADRDDGALDGGWRRLTSITRTEDRYRILGYVTTAAQHGLDRFTALLDTFLGRVWLPGPATLT